MANAQPGAIQMPGIGWEEEEQSPSQLTEEYVVLLLRVLAGKTPGDVWRASDGEACRNALRAIRRNW